VTETRARLAAAKPASVDEVRHHAGTLVAFTAEMTGEEAAIKAFLKRHMYRHPRVMRVMGDAERVVSNLFAHYRAVPADMPAEWLPPGGHEPEGDFARRVCNYIAGMTDLYALTEHRRIFDSTPDLR
ncbi:MAG: deoxyguanosinetriphosphate triphosphohydrolase, partial [Rhizobiales bacterium]|nr:deoxyguanosinetriphosphate triphosphohydrolase [Hyphomicrobiales bacterium]